MRNLDMRSLKLLTFAATFVAGSVGAESVDIIINKVTSRDLGEEIGKIKVTDTQYGALFTPKLSGLSSGGHGFHIHQNPNCGPKDKKGKMVPGLAAGGHYDPVNTDFHSGPYGEGHLGDLSFLYVDSKGEANSPILAPRVKVSDLKGHSLMIHAGGDNYSDTPKKLGGGGARMACGVIK
jgi:Cu-Zn family superoxide dismutase